MKHNDIKDGNDDEDGVHDDDPETLCTDRSKHLLLSKVNQSF